MDNCYYKLDDNHNTIPCEMNEIDWSDEVRRVANTEIKTLLERFINFITFGKLSIGESIRISTVFLGINHNYSRHEEPILFETMVFGGRYDEEQERYTTWEKAEIGHKQWVKKVSKSIF